jgi:hypothetical protein
MIISIVLVLLGFYTLNVALATLPNDFTLGTIYFVVAILSFGFVAFSIVRVRRGYSLANPPNKVLSIVKCRNCNFKQLKNFALGDYVAKTLGMCTQCNAANLFIDGIYGEGSGRR